MPTFSLYSQHFMFVDEEKKKAKVTNKKKLSNKITDSLSLL